MGRTFHLGGLRAGLNVSGGGGRFSLGGRGGSAVMADPYAALIAQLQGSNPSMILVADAQSYSASLTSAGLWTDASGSGNHAAAANIQASPDLVLDAWNGRAVLCFDAGDDGLMTPLNLTLGTTGYAIVLAEIPGSGRGNYRSVQSSTHNALISTGRGSGDSYYLDGDVYASSGPGILGQMCVASLSCPASGHAEAHFNGHNITSGSAAVEDWGGVILGAVGSRTEPAAAGIGAVVIAPYGQRAAVTQALADYYTVSLSA